MRRFAGPDSRFVVIELEDAKERLDIALGPLGRADLKGLPSPCLYEILAGDLLGDGMLERLETSSLKSVLDSLSDEPVASLVGRPRRAGSPR